MIKKIILAAMVVFTAPLYALEITKVNSLNFGEVVKGDKYVKLTNVRVYVEGEPGEDVKIYYPERSETDAGELIMNARERTITLSSNGRGRFSLDCKLNLSKSNRAGRINQRIPISVSYK